MNKLIFFVLFLTLLSCQRQELPTHFSVATTNGVFKSEEHRGQNIFLFFGFSQCPHVCPTTLSNLHRFVTALPEHNKRQVEVVFVSVDIERDNRETLTKRLESFPKNFHGGIESAENLKKLLEKFGASYHVYKGKDPTDIIIDHTALIFMLNKKGEWVDSLKYDSTPEEIRAAFDKSDTLTPVTASHRFDRVIEELGENKNCDLSKSPCEILGYKMTLGPYPIRADKEYKIKVEGSKLGKPVEVDFVGVQKNMGLIRPKLDENENGQFKGTLSIPVCELPQMTWKARLILETHTGPKSLTYYLNTTN